MNIHEDILQIIFLWDQRDQSIKKPPRRVVFIAINRGIYSLYLRPAPPPREPPPPPPRLPPPPKDERDEPPPKDERELLDLLEDPPPKLPIPEEDLRVVLPEPKKPPLRLGGGVRPIVGPTLNTVVLRGAGLYVRVRPIDRKDTTTISIMMKATTIIMAPASMPPASSP